MFKSRFTSVKTCRKKNGTNTSQQSDKKLPNRQTRFNSGSDRIDNPQRRNYFGVSLCLMLGVLVGNDAAADVVLDQQSAQKCFEKLTGALYFAKTVVVKGESDTLNWQVNQPAECQNVSYQLHISGFDLTTPMTVTRSDSKNLVPPLSGEWRFEATSIFGSKLLATTSIQVNDPIPLAQGSQVRISKSNEQQRKLLVQALATPKATIIIADGLELDLSGLDGVSIANGVRMQGEQTSHPKGPRLFTTTFPEFLFIIGDPDKQTTSTGDIQISGIRFDGGEPNDPGASAGNIREATAFKINAAKHVEFSQNEFYKWRGSGILILDSNAGVDLHNLDRDNVGDLKQTIWVHDNYIHDNQHPTVDSLFSLSGHGAGYGVAIDAHAYALVERNVFSNNRHSITGSNGSTGSGFLAYRNLFFSPGVDSIHGPIVNFNHIVDMHGSQSCGSWSWNCGPAGEYMDIAYNTFLFNTAHSIKLRGTPAVGMDVRDNVFAYSTFWGGAVDQIETGLQDAGNNVLFEGLNLGFYIKGVKRSAHPNIIQCDFDGDGIKDLFLATGETHWYRSSRQGGRFVFLEQSKAAMEDVILGDSTGDGRCDVTVNGQTVFPILSGPANSLLGKETRLNLSATGGVAPYNWVVNGLPPGLSASSTGEITGTPADNSANAYWVNVVVTDAQSRRGTTTYLWTVKNVVPDLRGSSTRSINKIALTHFTLGQMNTVNNCVDPGMVFSQQPSAGIEAPVGTPIDLTIASCVTDHRGGRGPVYAQ